MTTGEKAEPQQPDLRKLLLALEQLHVDDPARSQWPDEQDAVGVLDYTRRHHRALDPTTAANTARGDQAVIRLHVIQLLRGVLDNEALAAMDDARAAKVPWQRLAEVLGLKHAGAAANHALRLRAAVQAPAALRSPQTGRVVLANARRDRERAAREARAVARQHQQARNVVRELLEHIADLAVDSEAVEWLASARQLAGVASPTGAQQAALVAHTRLAARAITQHAKAVGVPASSSAVATAALMAALGL